MASQAPQVQFTIEPYGEFTARIRDFDTEFRISYRTDEQMVARGMDPNKASAETRNLFALLTTFSETCETPPVGFDVGELLRGDPATGYKFVTDYVKALVEKEKSFRTGVQTVVQGNGVGPTADESIQGTQDPAVGPAS